MEARLADVQGARKETTKRVTGKDFVEGGVLLTWGMWVRLGSWVLRKKKWSFLLAQSVCFFVASRLTPQEVQKKMQIMQKWV